MGILLFSKPISAAVMAMPATGAAFALSGSGTAFSQTSPSGTLSAANGTFALTGEAAGLSNSTSGLKINLSFDASWSGAPANYTTDANTAAALLMAAFPNTNVTLTIQVGYNEIAGQSIPPVASEATDNGVVSIAYTTVRSAMQARATATGNASLVAAANNLPSGSTIGGTSTLVVSWGVCKLLGIFGVTGGPTSATDTSQPDGWMGITSGWSTSVGGTVDVFLHELSHAMGRVPGEVSFNLTRFTAPGVREVGGAHGATVYFSLDNGTTNLALYDTNNDPSDFDDSVLAPGGGHDSFDAHQFSDSVQVLTPLNIQLMNSMGYV